MSVFDHPSFDAHEIVHAVHDPQFGLMAIIGVHSTARGPSCGGCRIWSYDSSEQALDDVLRLSMGMSYKSAMAGLDLGGGKCVVLKPKGDFDRSALFKALGRAIEKLGGVYRAAADVGIIESDLLDIKSQTDFIGGLPTNICGSGDSSPVTAEGIFRGIKIAAQRRFEREDLLGLTVAVQGVGNVGMALCGHLHDSGAKLIVTDVNGEAVKTAQKRFGARAVSLDEIYDVQADIFAPCALGRSVNVDTIRRINAKVIAGGANNQLSTPDMGAALMERGMLYAPDYVINAGGIINIASEIKGRYDPEFTKIKLTELEQTLDHIFTQSMKTGRATPDIADEIARQRIGR